MSEAELLVHAPMKFGIGQPAYRKEDARLLRGGGCYTDDIHLPGQCYGVMVRSEVAHGILHRLDVAAAQKLPGVLAVYTSADLLAAGYGTLPCPVALKNSDGSEMAKPPRHALAVGKVRYAGEGIAFVVAETLAAAKDGAELVAANIEPLAAVSNVAAAALEGAPQLFDEVPNNVCLDWSSGDRAAVDKAFEEAAHVTRLALVNNRIVVAAIEPRVAIFEYDAETDRYTLHLASQGVFGLHQGLSKLILKIEPERLRVRTHDVGGSFGMKASPYPEYVPLFHACRELSRAVKWCDERSGSFVSDQHARDAVMDCALALDAEGNFLAIRCEGFAGLGAYLSTFGPAMPTVNILKNMPSLYKTPAIFIHTRCIFTNSTPVGPYRGAGRPEGNYYMERLIDQAARETGRDAVELRRRNLIPPAAIPFDALSGLTIDSGDFEAVLDDALARADWAGAQARRCEAKARGKLRGIAVATYLEVTGPPGREMARLHLSADGGAHIVSGTQNYGQGHASTFAQILSEHLGLDFERIELIQGDSDILVVGGGTGGSRSTISSGTAIVAAAEEVIARGRALAGHVLEAAKQDILFEAGRFTVAGTDRAIALADLVRFLHEQGGKLPAELPQSLDVEAVIDTPPSSFPNGCHICEVEIDPETGTVDLVRYVVVDDFGTLINPDLVEGQVHGGVVQGQGQVLMENVVYDGDGQLLSGSFMDYALPRADQVPDMVFASHPVPATTNPLGVKGCGEAGTTGALPAIANAVADALAQAGAAPIDMPMTPEKVWRALSAARRQGMI